MFLEKKTSFKIWLNPGLNLTIFVDSSLIPRAKRKDLGNEVEIVYMSNMARSFETVCAMQLYILDGIELAEASAGDVYK